MIVWGTRAESETDGASHAVTCYL